VKNRHGVSLARRSSSPHGSLATIRTALARGGGGSAKQCRLAGFAVREARWRAATESSTDARMITRNERIDALDFYEAFETRLFRKRDSMRSQKSFRAI